MLGVHIRIENTVHDEIDNMAKLRGISFSQMFREIVDVGLRVKKHMEGKDSGDENSSDQHLEQGASAAIESLILLRKIANNYNSEWPIKAREEAHEKINGA